MNGASGRPPRKLAAPAPSQVRAEFGTLDRDDDFFKQRAQQCFAVPVGGGYRVPGAFEVAAESGDRTALLHAKDAGSLLLTQRQFCLGGRQFPQAVFPLGLQAARDESILSISRAVTTLSALRFILLAFNFASELRQAGEMIRFQLLGSLERGFQAC